MSGLILPVGLEMGRRRLAEDMERLDNRDSRSQRMVRLFAL